MLEMIFVIVVLSIVAGGTFLQIAGVYESMMQKQYSGELQTEAKVIAEQVSSRLSSSIKDSLVAMTKTDGTGCQPVSSLTGNAEYILAWVGRSDESNLGLWDTNDYKPGWSGFVDVSISDANSISTKGSKLSTAEIIINQLTNDTTTLSTTPKTAIYFSGSGTNTNACDDFFNTYAASKMYKVKIGATDTDLAQVDKQFANISEQYALSHSAYAIGRNGTDLFLYSFRPWLGETPDSDASPKLLGRNITGFAFKWEGGLFRVNICVGRTLNGFPIEVCKERAVF
jgi:hypothetical protein